ncbi:hypothetical protein BDB01DRAFT_771310 [Pilobolus umbonatus]|nr:hypothetical protein BDB01DRAFT_771310 [Pilobolus umbonatus]
MKNTQSVNNWFCAVHIGILDACISIWVALLLLFVLNYLQKHVSLRIFWIFTHVLTQISLVLINVSDDLIKTATLLILICLCLEYFNKSGIRRIRNNGCRIHCL